MHCKAGVRNLDTAHLFLTIQVTLPKYVTRPESVDAWRYMIPLKPRYSLESGVGHLAPSGPEWYHSLCLAVLCLQPACKRACRFHPPCGQFPARLVLTVKQ